MRTNLLVVASLIAMTFFGLALKSSAQGTPLEKTLTLIPNDVAWGDVLTKTEPCSIPGESSCSHLDAQTTYSIKSNTEATPLKSFSQNSAPVTAVNANNPNTLASIIAPALAKIAKKNTMQTSSIETLAAEPATKTTPLIHGGNGTFTTLPSGVQRANQAAQQTLRSLSSQNVNSSNP